MAPALFLRQHVHFRLEVRVRRDRAGLCQHLSALHAFALDATQETADIIARLTLIEQLAEHLDARNGGLLRRANADDLDFLADLDHAAVDTAGDDGAAAGNREHVLDRHHERLIDRAVGLRNVFIHCLHQFEDGLLAHLLVAIFEREQGRAADDRNRIARKFVARKEFAHLELDEIEKLGIIHHVDLVHVHDERRHADLARQQNVLARLRHRAVGGGDNENGAIHLRRAGDHVLHVVSMPRAIDVGVMPLVGLIFDVRCRNGNSARLLFRRLVDLVVGGEFRLARFRQHLGDGRRQRRLAMVHMADRADVAMRLCPLELCFCHGVFSSLTIG